MVRHNAAGYQAEVLSDFYWPEYTTPANLSYLEELCLKGKNLMRAPDILDGTPICELFEEITPVPQLRLVTESDYTECPPDILFAFADALSIVPQHASDDENMCVMLYATQVTENALQGLQDDFSARDAMDVRTRCLSIAERLGLRIRQRTRRGLQLV